MAAARWFGRSWSGGTRSTSGTQVARARTSLAGSAPRLHRRPPPTSLSETTQYANGTRAIFDTESTALCNSVDVDTVVLLDRPITSDHPAPGSASRARHPTWGAPRGTIADRLRGRTIRGPRRSWRTRIAAGAPMGSRFLATGAGGSRRAGPRSARARWSSAPRRARGTRWRRGRRSASRDRVLAVVAAVAVARGTACTDEDFGWEHVYGRCDERLVRRAHHSRARGGRAAAACERGVSSRVLANGMATADQRGAERASSTTPGRSA